MRQGVLLALVLVLTGVVATAAGGTTVRTCGSGFVHADLRSGEKCLRKGQYCRIKADREYHRYGFHCHTGRLSRAAAGGNASGSGCQRGYSPCLPRVADLNCDDLSPDRRPVRVTGRDPYRLDRDGDGIACE
jgi:hypothetical protein